MLAEAGIINDDLPYDVYGPPTYRNAWQDCQQGVDVPDSDNQHGSDNVRMRLLAHAVKKELKDDSLRLPDLISTADVGNSDYDKHISYLKTLDEAGEKSKYAEMMYNKYSEDDYSPQEAIDEMESMASGGGAHWMHVADMEVYILAPRSEDATITDNFKAYKCDAGTHITSSADCLQASPVGDGTTNSDDILHAQFFKSWMQHGIAVDAISHNFVDNCSISSASCRCGLMARSASSGGGYQVYYADEGWFTAGNSMEFEICKNKW